MNADERGGVEALRKALEWYAGQAANCRKVTREGEDARRLLDADGSKRACAALAASPRAPEWRVPEGWIAVPAKPSMEWVQSLATYWQGQRDTPRCEAPSAYEVQRAHRAIADTLAARPPLPDAGAE